MLGGRPRIPASQNSPQRLGCPGACPERRRSVPRLWGPGKRAPIHFHAGRMAELPCLRSGDSRYSRSGNRRYVRVWPSMWCRPSHRWALNPYRVLTSVELCPHLVRALVFMGKAGTMKQGLTGKAKADPRSGDDRKKSKGKSKGKSKSQSKSKSRSPFRG